MWNYVAGRLIAVVPVVFFVSIAVFMFIHLLPGDPVIAMIGTGDSADPHMMELRRHELGLDRPLPVQYADWMRGLFTGDLGRSAITRQPLTEALRERIPVTLQLAVASFIISLVIAIPAGIISAYKRNSLLDRVITVIALMGVAMPSFWLGILLILFFAVELRWFPPSGFVSITTDPLESLRYLALPALSLGAVQAAVIMRQMRSSLLEVLNEDYVRTARAKGLRERRVVLVHGMRNALLPVVTVVGLQVGRVIGGSVIIETVFAMPGMGRYAVNAIFDRDYPVVQVTVLITAVVVVLANLATDLLYGVFDPRIKLG